MLAAIISDTHLYEVSPWLERAYARHLAGADLLIHCGDVTGKPVWSFFMQHPGFHGVCGNMDEWGLRPELPDRLSLSVEGVRVGACHGWGPRPGLAARIAEAYGESYDLFFFGHSHAQQDVRHGGARMVNPGSFQEGDARFALARIENGTVDIVFKTAD